ncbi:hypothetical protein [Hamadaea tsunoensis]|uniref:hypothetical protein n=1 Tax=Hamadaea tsunoensis TaxID=53368 RepID=UPI0003F978C9|nr:hypothetical protein [Hamadaea tsunoensis]
MGHLTRPRHPIVDRALNLSRRYCDGQIIDDAPAFTHACRVAVALGTHDPASTPEMIAAALLHDTPEFAHPDTNLSVALAYGVADGVAPLVLAVHDEHQAMTSGTAPRVPSDGAVTRIMAADKVIAFRALVRRASRSPDPVHFWSHREGLRKLMPWFAEWSALAAPGLPPSLRGQLTQSYAQLSAAMSGAPSASAAR